MSRPGPRQGLGNTVSGDAFAALEARYIDARKRGVGFATAGDQLNLTGSAHRKFEDGYRYATHLSAGSDGSVPKFARHDEHVSVALRAGGFKILAIKRRGISVGAAA